MDAGRAWRAAGRVLCGWMLWAAVCGNTAEVEVAGEIKTSSRTDFLRGTYRPHGLGFLRPVFWYLKSLFAAYHA